MFKTFACFLVVAVASTYGQFVNSGSVNTGLNAHSVDSIVSQNNIQNAQAFGGYGFASYVPYPYVPQSGYVGLPGYVAAYPAFYGFEHNYYPFPAWGPGFGYGLGHVNSHSVNTGANIQSSNSVVAQNDVQNAISSP